MWELNHKEDWALKNWCFQIVSLEKTLESPLDCREIKPVNPKGNQPWILIGRTDAEIETPILWPPDAKSWLIGNYPDPGKDWKQKEKGMAENKMVERHQWVNGHEFDQTPEDSEGQKEPGMLQFMGSQRVRHELVTEQQQTLWRSYLNLSQQERQREFLLICAWYATIDSVPVGPRFEVYQKTNKTPIY